MLESIIGDIVGSPYEFHNIKSKDFKLFSEKCCFTDATILTCATAEWLLSNKKPEELLKKWGNLYKNRIYENGKMGAFGQGFTNWLKTGEPYGAKKNGCIMRLSLIPLMIDDLKQALDKAICFFEAKNIFVTNIKSLIKLSKYYIIKSVFLRGIL